MTRKNGRWAAGARLVLFDWDGTLRHNDPPYADTFLNIAFRLGAPDTPQGRRSGMRWLHYYWAKSEELVSDQRSLDDRSEAFWINHARLVLLALGCSDGQAATLAPDAFQHMNDEFHATDLVPADIPPALQKLKEAGYLLAVLSNRSHPYDQQVQTLGLDSFFEFAMCAGGVESWKPDPAVFLKAVEQVGVLPQETLYVGDNYYADVIGSQRAGLIPVLIDPIGLFPEADCKVISQVGELPELLKNFTE